MTIRLGTGELSALKLGSTDIGKAYLGSTVIWETTPAPSWKWAIEGTVSSVNGSEADLVDIVDYGETNNFSNRAPNEYRISPSNTYLEMLCLVDAGGDFGDVDGFFAATTNRRYDFYYDGVKLAATTYPGFNQSNAILRARASAATTAENSTFWTNSTVPTGKTIRMELSYDLI